MPSLERDAEAFLGECDAVPLCLGTSGDFGKDSRLSSSYGSTASTLSASSTTTALPPSDVQQEKLLQPKDPEQWPLLSPALPPPGGWGLGVPPGLSAADILPLANDPFWCRVRAAFMALFWVVMVALLAAVAVIVANDPMPCSARPPPAPEQTFNVSLPLSALPVLQAVAAS
ncbi:4F2 cell-surface antigen heavy chain, partial [Frankliniella fusca]